MKNLLFFFVLICVVQISYQEECSDENCDSTQGNCSNNCNSTQGECIYGYCQCNEEYATYPYNSTPYCTYKRKKQWKAFVLEAVVAFGSGHLYTENYGRGISKLIFWVIGWTFFIMMRFFSVKNGKRDETAFIFSMLSCFFTFGMIIWYAIDVVLIGINRYRDGNGISFESWE